MFCPFCGVKNNADQQSCFVCSKKLPSLESEAQLQRVRPTTGPRPRLQAPVAARLGDRLIAAILDTVLISAALLVSGAALSGRLRDVQVSATTMIAAAAF